MFEYTVNNKRNYILPDIVEIRIDNEISLALESDLPPTYEKIKTSVLQLENPFKI